MQVPDDQQLVQNTRKDKVACGLIENILDGSSEDLSRPASNGEITAIDFPEPGRLRSRRVVTRSRFRSTGKYPSWKMKRLMQWESVHERNSFRLLDADPQVKSFNEQPCIIHYVNNGESHKHTPDILVELKRGTKELWEVKTRYDASSPNIVTRTSLLTECLRKYGYCYRVILSEDLAVQPRLCNTIALLRHGYHAISELERESIRLIFKKNGHLVWSEACQGHYGKRGQQILCRLVLEGVVVVDLETPFAPDTRFVVGNGGL